jgi:3-hydroxyacyl-[acyl-carrier-protein] dehydratase
MDIKQILEHLPHRYPFLLVDRVLEIKEGNSIRALKNVSINEPYFTGHFPGHPVMPGVLLIEALAQTTALLSFNVFGHSRAKDTFYYLVGTNNARFRKPVVPGDQLILEAVLEKSKGGIFVFETWGSVDGTKVVEAQLMSAIRKSDPVE